MKYLSNGHDDAALKNLIPLDLPCGALSVQFFSFFVRPIVRRRIEVLASEAGQNEIDEAFYEQAKAQFGEK